MDVTNKIKTVTFDPSIYKLVPVAMSPDMRFAATGEIPFHLGQMDAAYEAAIKAVPDQLQGVVEHSGEPVAWNCNGYPFTDYAQAVVFAQANMFPVTPLYTHPALSQHSSHQHKR